MATNLLPRTARECQFAGERRVARSRTDFRARPSRALRPVPPILRRNRPAERPVSKVGEHRAPGRSWPRFSRSLDAIHSDRRCPRANLDPHLPLDRLAVALSCGVGCARRRLGLSPFPPMGHIGPATRRPDARQNTVQPHRSHLRATATRVVIAARKPRATVRPLNACPPSPAQPTAR